MFHLVVSLIEGFFIHFFVGEEILVSTLVGLGFIILGLLVQQQGHKMPKVKN